jgi:hypothetical protein
MGSMVVILSLLLYSCGSTKTISDGRMAKGVVYNVEKLQRGRQEVLIQDSVTKKINLPKKKTNDSSRQSSREKQCDLRCRLNSSYDEIIESTMRHIIMGNLNMSIDEARKDALKVIGTILKKEISISEQKTMINEAEIAETSIGSNKLLLDMFTVFQNTKELLSKSRKTPVIVTTVGIIIALVTVMVFSCCHKSSKDEIYVSMEVQEGIEQMEFFVNNLEIQATSLDKTLRNLELNFIE